MCTAQYGEWASKHWEGEFFCPQYIPFPQMRMKENNLYNRHHRAETCKSPQVSELVKILEDAERNPIKQQPHYVYIKMPK